MLNNIIYLKQKPRDKRHCLPVPFILNHQVKKQYLVNIGLQGSVSKKYKLNTSYFILIVIKGSMKKKKVTLVLMKNMFICLAILICFFLLLVHPI